MMAQYESEPHHFLTMSKKSRCAYVYCVKCGHIAMNNDLSKWATKQGCNHKDHSSYESKLGLTNPFGDT